MALEAAGVTPDRLVIASGIGQAPKMPHYVACNGLDGIHGRALPAALGAYLVDPTLTYVVVDGDGGAYAEGTNHFVHALRRNPRMVYLVHDNRVFGLTKGQASPTSDPDFKTKTSPRGTMMPPFNPLGVAIANNGTFVARGYAGDVDHLAWLIGEALAHPGFAFVDVLQPCVSFNRVNTYKWYRQRVYKLEDRGHDPTDRATAFELSFQWGEEIPTGVFYRTIRTTFHEQFTALDGGRRLDRSPLDSTTVRTEVLSAFRAK